MVRARDDKMVSDGEIQYCDKSCLCVTLCCGVPELRGVRISWEMYRTKDLFESRRA